MSTASLRGKADCLAHHNGTIPVRRKVLGVLVISRHDTQCGLADARSLQSAAPYYGVWHTPKDMRELTEQSNIHGHGRVIVIVTRHRHSYHRHRQSRRQHHPSSSYSSPPSPPSPSSHFIATIIATTIFTLHRHHHRHHQHRHGHAS